MSSLDPTLQSDGGTAAANAAPAQVLVVDDDASVRAALGRLLGLQGYAVTTFHSAESLLAQHDPHAYGCIILDVAMPGLDGLALQQALEQRGNQMPIIFLTGQADVPMCAQAMKRGAFDFLTKPVDDTVLFAAVARALQRDAELLSARARREATESRLATLTAREREVLDARDRRTAEQADRRRPGHRREDHQGPSRARHGEDAVRSVAELVRVMERTRPETPGSAG